jgi:hypothetical protein
MIRFTLVLLVLSGCVEHAELRTQQCAHRCIDRYGSHPPAGAFGSEAHADRCRCLLWDHRVERAGRLTSNRWPE